MNTDHEDVVLNIRIAAIQLDETTQCRAVTDYKLVCEYAEGMTENDPFPPVALFGTEDRCWIGDGWHRILAAKKIGAVDLPARLYAGGRTEALKHALGANRIHGLRLTNKDKHRRAEIAVREFRKLSTAQIAEMCGVSRPLVEEVRRQGAESAPSTVIGKDGKEYPASLKRPGNPESDQVPVDSSSSEDIESTDPGDENTEGRPRNGMHYARLAVQDLEEIAEDDSERSAAFQYVKTWIAEAEATMRHPAGRSGPRRAIRDGTSSSSPSRNWRSMDCARAFTTGSGPGVSPSSKAAWASRVRIVPPTSSPDRRVPPRTGPEGHGTQDG